MRSLDQEMTPGCSIFNGPIRRSSSLLLERVAEPEAILLQEHVRLRRSNPAGLRLDSVAPSTDINQVLQEFGIQNVTFWTVNQRHLLVEGRTPGEEGTGFHGSTAHFSTAGLMKVFFFYLYQRL